MKKLVLFFKLMVTGIIILWHAIMCFFIFLLNGLDIEKARKRLQYQTTRISRIVVRLLPLKINLKGKISRDKPFLVVANHTGTLDIFVTSSLISGTFITSKEMRETKGLGEICYYSGCHFVNRKNPKSLVREINYISKTINKGENLILFPEAKATDGSEVIEFKNALFEIAFKNKHKVIPLSINYKKINGVEVTSQNKDQIFWYGDMPFFPHLVSLLMNGEVEVDVVVGEVIDSEDCETRQELTDKAYNFISKNYKKIN